MMDNLELYNKVRTVPQEAKKPIQGGRLSGKTDINPMWRIKELTEVFGPCGIGWKYTIEKLWLETGASGEISAFALISLYVRQDEKWSDAIPGIGGSAFVANEKNGLYTSDECYKMALTDAISVACKALGMGADVYWNSGKTKYDGNAERPAKVNATKVNVIKKLAAEVNVSEKNLMANVKGNYKVDSLEELSDDQASKILIWLKGKQHG